jgi:hypothetical protein
MGSHIPAKQLGTAAFTFSKLSQGPGYQYDLKTTGLARSSYNLLFTITGDPTVHAAAFRVT